MLYQPMEYIINPLSNDEVFMYITDDIVPNIQPYYLISNYGRVYSTRSGRFMKPTLNIERFLNIRINRNIDSIFRDLYKHDVYAFIIYRQCTITKRCSTTSSRGRRAQANGVRH